MFSANWKAGKPSKSGAKRIAVGLKVMATLAVFIILLLCVWSMSFGKQLEADGGEWTSPRFYVASCEAVILAVWAGLFFLGWIDWVWKTPSTKADLKPDWSEEV
jgi:hypothetical protein